MNIILTGGSKGIGETVLNNLVENNKVLVLSRTKPKEHKNIEWIYADLSNVECIDRLEKKIKSFKCDVLINNAGSGKVEDLERLNSQEITNELILNLVAPMRLTSYVSENMKKNNYGRIINISSISALSGTPYLFAYSASKAGLSNFTQSAAEYFKDYDITVNTICPGGIDTNMAVEGRKQISKFLNNDLNKYQKDMITAMGLKELISKEEVAKTIDFIIEMPSINAQSINICGLLQK